MSIAIEFPPDLVWAAIQELLSSALGDEVNVDCIGEHDFDEEGELIFELPAARVLFVEEGAVGFENTNTAYNTEQIFAVLCGDEDLSPDPQDQRTKSLQLAGRVKHYLVGARLLITGQEDDTATSEPVKYQRMSTLADKEGRIIYIPQFSVGGIAQFAAPNAYPGTSEED